MICKEEFLETCEDLIQDVLPLDALSRYKEQNRHPMLRCSEEELAHLYRRLLDYLSQHAGELRRYLRLNF